MRRQKTLRHFGIFFCFAAVFLAAAQFTNCDPALFWERRSHLTDIAGQMLSPDWSYTGKVLPLLWSTLQMSVTGTGVGALLALLAAPLCAGNLPGNRALRTAARILIQILRAFPTLILALTATFFFGLGVFSGTAAITVYTFAIMTRLTYEDIEHNSLGAYHALLALGARSFPTYIRAVVPEIASSYLTNVLYLLETNVRHSAILGYVGAGGIGLLLNEKVSWREYNRAGTILILLFAVVLCIEYGSSFLTDLVQGKRQIPPVQRRFAAAGFGLLFLICTLTIAPPDFSHTSQGILQTMAHGLLHPDLSMIFCPDETGVPYLLLETAAIAVVGTCLGTILALPLAFLGSKRFLPAPLAWLFRTVVTAIRSIPFLIYGLIFIRVSGPGAFTGVLTLAVCSIGLLCKRFLEAIDALDFRPYEALAAMGVPAAARIRYAVLPQLLPQLLSAILYRFDVNMREASVLGLAGAGGIGAPLIFAMNHYAWNEVGALLLGLIILVWLIDLWSGRCRKRWQDK